MSDIRDIFRTVLNVLKQPSGWASIIFDVLIIAVLIYNLLVWTRETRAYQVLKGIGLLFLVSVLSRLLGLTTISWVLDSILASGTIFLILFILFTPEIRRVLERLGSGSKRLGKRVITNDPVNRRLVFDLQRTILRLSQRRVGALLVFERRSGLGDIASTGTQLDADLSGALIENIFEPKTPLHDGAVLIRGTTIVAAACLLPLSDDPKVSRDLGTRHRAAIGVSAMTDCVVLVVSEETGAISMARDGKLIRYLDEKALSNVLEGLLLEGDTGFLFPWQRPRNERKQKEGERA